MALVLPTKAPACGTNPALHNTCLWHQLFPPQQLPMTPVPSFHRTTLRHQSLTSTVTIYDNSPLLQCTSLSASHTLHSTSLWHVSDLQCTSMWYQSYPSQQQPVTPALACTTSPTHHSTRLWYQPYPQQDYPCGTSFLPPQYQLVAPVLSITAPAFDTSPYLFNASLRHQSCPPHHKPLTSVLSSTALACSTRPCPSQH